MKLAKADTPPTNNNFSEFINIFLKKKLDN